MSSVEKTDYKIGQDNVQIFGLDIHNPVFLIIMASHVPGFRDYVFASNSGYLASHTDLSIFVVR